MPPFDPDAYLAKKEIEEPTTSSFDPDAYLAKKEGSLSLEEPSDGLNLEAPISLGTTQLAQDAVTRIASKSGEGIQKALVGAGSIMSEYSPEQIREIKSNYSTFKQDPINVLNKLEQKAAGTNVEALQLEKSAFDELQGKRAVTPEEYRGLVEKTATSVDERGNPRFAEEISPTVMKDVKDKAFSTVEQSAKVAEADELSQFAKIKAQEEVNKFKSTNLGQMTDDAAVKLASEIEENVLKNPEAFGYQKKRDLMKLWDEYNTAKNVGTSKVSTKLADTFPSLVGKDIVSSDEKSLRQMLDLGSNADISAEKMYNINQKLSTIGYDATGKKVSDVPAAGQKIMREKVTEIAPKAGGMFKAESELIEQLNRLENAGYIKRGNLADKAKAGFVRIDDAQKAKLVKDLSNADPVKLTQMADDLDVLEKFAPEAAQELRLAAYKLSESRHGIGFVPSSGLNKIIEGLTTKSAARTLATIPEAIASAIPASVKTGAAVAGKVLSKIIPPIGAGVGATMGMIEAKKEGFNPWEAAAYSAFEAVNPFPVSGIEAMKMQGDIEKKAGMSGKELYRSERSAISNTLLNKKQVDIERGVSPSTSKDSNFSDTKFSSTKGPEMTSFAEQLEQSGDKAAAEYARVIRQVISSPEQQKQAILHSLNQDRNFRRLVGDLKGSEE